MILRKKIFKVYLLLFIVATNNTIQQQLFHPSWTVSSLLLRIHFLIKVENDTIVQLFRPHGHPIHYGEFFWPAVYTGLFTAIKLSSFSTTFSLMYLRKFVFIPGIVAVIFKNFFKEKKGFFCQTTASNFQNEKKKDLFFHNCNHPHIFFITFTEVHTHAVVNKKEIETTNRNVRLYQ